MAALFATDPFFFILTDSSVKYRRQYKVQITLETACTLFRKALALSGNLAPVAKPMGYRSTVAAAQGSCHGRYL